MYNYDNEDKGYYPEWLTDQKCGDMYKSCLVDAYNSFWDEKDKELKKKKLEDLKVYLMIVSDVIAYRYLVKHYHNLFHRLCITFEEYIDYKVERMYVTIRDKKEKIDDILSYIYMSFMLSSPRLIYDYAEKIGRCKTVRELLPYFQTQRNKFFFIDKSTAKEHYIYNVDNIDLDEDSEYVRSNLDRYSLMEYNKKQSIENSSDTGMFEEVIKFIEKSKFSTQNAKNVLLNLLNSWSQGVEDDFLQVKQSFKGEENKDFNLIDYIRYQYDNNLLGVTYDEYRDILSVLNNLLKNKRR